MGYAVEMFFDKKSEDTIRWYWENLHNDHLSMSIMNQEADHIYHWLYITM